MRAAVRRMGNSSGVIIPKTMLGLAGLNTGDQVEMEVQDGRIVLAPVRTVVRAGWAEAAARIAAGDDASAWPEFPNAEDDDLTW